MKVRTHMLMPPEVGESLLKRLISKERVLHGIYEVLASELLWPYDQRLTFEVEKPGHSS